MKEKGLEPMVNTNKSVGLHIVSSNSFEGGDLLYKRWALQDYSSFVGGERVLKTTMLVHHPQATVLVHHPQAAKRKRQSRET